MSGRRYAFIVALCIFALFVATNLAAQVWLKGARLDLTQNQLYSLSRGTRDVLADLNEPLELKLFYSRDAAARYPAVQAYAARVRELLDEYQARSRGRVRFVEVDPKPFSEAEDEAVEAGVEPASAYEGADPIYFGLAGANAINDRRAIPFFAQEREPFLEYEITRLIYELENPDLPKIALITALPMDPAFAPDDMQFGQGAQSLFSQELGRLMEVEKLDPTFTDIPADADVLAIIHPYPLSPAQLYAIDQFILARGRAFIAVDPGSERSLRQSFDPLSGPSMVPTSSNLEPLLSRWGVAMGREVVLDLNAALPVQATDANGAPQAVPQPLFFRVDPDRLDREDLATAWLQRGLTFAMAGALQVSERPNITTRTLARTTGETMRIPADYAMTQPTPFDLLQNWAPQRRGETLAVRLSGTLPTAFPNGPPEGAAARARRLTQSERAAELIIVGDADFLSDEFYVAPQQGTFADNGAFALNALDVLSGSDAMVSLRSRAPSLRRMTTLDRMESRAQADIQQRQSALEAELRNTEARLAELQARGQGSGYFSGNLGAELTRDERAEMERFRARMADVRAELRAVGRDLRADINRLEGWVTFVNMWLAPLLVAAAGVFIFWRRQRRTHVKPKPEAGP